MTYFPQPNSANPAKRVKLVSSVAVAIRSEDTQPVRAKMQDLSATGGLLILSKALDQGDFVELAILDQPGDGSRYGRASASTMRIGVGVPATLSVHCHG